ncbi:hypothetical protein, partial [Kitasatospora sp. NPDC001225]
MREGYRVLATWAIVDLGTITRDTYRNDELGRGNHSPTDLAERLGGSPSAISGAASGTGWNPPINRSTGVLAHRRTGAFSRGRGTPKGRTRDCVR